MSILKPREKIIFFVDRSLGGKEVPDRLRSVGEEVLTLTEKFSPETPDEVWLRHAGKSGWVALTHDQRIRYRHSQLETVKQCGVKLFVLGCSGNLKASEIADILIKALPAMKKIIQNSPAPFIAKIYRGGEVRKINF